MAFPQYIQTTPMSKPAPYQPQAETLVTLVQRAIAAYPGEEGRILRGAEIVERDGVRVRADGVYEVGIYHRYPVSGRCPCPDSALGHAPGGRCKHAFGKCLYRKLHTPAAPMRSLQFYAALHGTIGGVATVWESGKIEFIEHDTDIVITCSIEEIVLGGRKNWIDETHATHDASRSIT